MNIKTIKKALLECYSKDMCYYKGQDNWNENNKCLGMCAITSLIINDYFGGDICKMHIDDISHYFNLIDNKIVDLTSSQFNDEINYDDYQMYSNLTGLYVYDGKFAGVYSRLSDSGIISTQYNEKTVPTLFIKEES